MTIHAVLLIPGKGHERLLEEGPCGARPPMAHRVNASTYRGSGDAPEDWVWRAGPRISEPASDAEHGGCGFLHALVLAWEREVLNDGVYRCEHDWTELVTAIAYVLTGIDDGASLMEATEELGTIVLLDEDGREVER